MKSITIVGCGVIGSLLEAGDGKKNVVSVVNRIMK